jgi:hypothetical protein
MVEVLNEIVKHTEISYNDGRDSLKRIINSHEKNTAFSMKKYLSGRFMFAKSDPRRRELAEQIAEDINLLKRLNKGQEQITNFVVEGNLIDSQKSAAPFLDKVRRCSDNLYHAMSKIWRCGCHTSPSAMLKLESRETKVTSEIRFSLILTFQSAEDEVWAFQETEVSVYQR